MKRKTGFTLDKEEKDLLESFKRGEWRRVKNIKTEKEIAKRAANNFIRKDARINIRLSTTDLIRLKRIALNEGLPYQTLIASVLHKYAAEHIQNPLGD